jgi:hypothetical protein
MLMTELLDHDLHRSRGGTPVPLMLEVPVSKDSYPAVVSGTRGQFLVSRGPQESGLAGVGVFEYDSDKLDALLGPMLTVAHSLSVGGSRTSLKRVQRKVRGKLVGVPVTETVAGTFENSFTGKGAARAAFEHVQKSSGLRFQPHVCLVPSSWDEKAAFAFFGKKDYEPAKRKFSECCRVIFHDVPMPVFFSRPDMVGMYTQFLNGGASVILHNVELGLAFCPQG